MNSPVNKAYMSDYGRKWRLANADKVKQYNLDWYAKNREYALEKQTAWYANNKEKVKLRNEARRKENNAYQKNKAATDINWRIKTVLRARIRHCVKFGWKSGRSVQLLGCSVASFKIYLESQFQPGMSWDNYGKGKDKWNIDHVMPCSIFDLTNPRHQKRCFHFSNLQPMWETDNLRKSNKITTNQFKLL